MLIKLFFIYVMYNCISVYIYFVGELFLLCVYHLLERKEKSRSINNLVIVLQVQWVKSFILAEDAILMELHMYLWEECQADLWILICMSPFISGNLLLPFLTRVQFSISVMVWKHPSFPKSSHLDESLCVCLSIKRHRCV